MNKVTISVALTVLVCISFDHGHASTQAPNPTQTPAPTQAPAPTKTPVVTQAPVVTPAPAVTQAPVVTQAPGVSQAPTAAPGGNNTDRNGGSGARELSAKVLMIATMEGCTMAVYGGL